MPDSGQIHHALSAFLDALDDVAGARAPSVEVTVCPQRDYLNLRGNPDEPAFVAAAEGTLGVALPVVANTFTSGAGVQAFWLGPDEWLIVASRGAGRSIESRLENAPDGLTSVNDLGGGLICLRLAGAGVRELLARGCTLDLHPRAFGVGQCAQSGLARANVLLAMTGDAPEMLLVVRRTFADYLARWLAHAGVEGGIAFHCEERV